MTSRCSVGSALVPGPAGRGHRRPRRLRGDDGAAAIEAAVVAPVLLLVLMGVFEYGLLYRDLLGANDAVEAGAKYGSIQGSDLARLTAADGSELGFVTADYTILLNTRAGLAGLSPQSIERIVVFKAGPASRGAPMEQVPQACKTSATSIAGSCNVYLLPQAFQEIEKGNYAYFNCKTSSVACGWDPASDPPTRKDGPTLDAIDYLGVYLKARRQNVTGIVPAVGTIEVAAIHRLEPGQLQ